MHVETSILMDLEPDVYSAAQFEAIMCIIEAKETGKLSQHVLSNLDQLLDQQVAKSLD